MLADVRGISDMIDVSYVRQKEALGLGHAVLRVKELVGPEPFAVVLSDDVIDSSTPCIRQLLDVYEYFGASVLALMEVPRRRDFRVRSGGRRSGRAQRHAATACSVFAAWWKSRSPRTRPPISPSSDGTS